MPKARMTKDEKDFYNKMLKVIHSGIKPNDMPGPMWQKWVNLHLNKTF